MQIVEKIVLLFAGVITNHPERYLDGELTQGGRAGYLFTTLSSIIIFIEVKVDFSFTDNTAKRDTIV
jgi:hypothetical protein